MTDLLVRQSARWGAVPEALLEDVRLGLDARAVASWLATRPDGWEIRIDPLCRRLAVGRERWRRIARELEETGRLHRQRSQLADGRWRWTLVFDALGGLPPPPDSPKNESSTSTNAHPASAAVHGGSPGRPLTASELAQIEIEIEAANLAAARGQRKPVALLGRYKTSLAAQIRAGTFEPSAAALALAAARKAEVGRQARLAAPPPELPPKSIPPANAIADCFAALGLAAATHPT